MYSLRRYSRGVLQCKINQLDINVEPKARAFNVMRVALINLARST